MIFQYTSSPPLNEATLDRQEKEAYSDDGKFLCGVPSLERMTTVIQLLWEILIMTLTEKDLIRKPAVAVHPNMDLEEKIAYLDDQIKRFKDILDEVEEERRKLVTLHSLEQKVREMAGEILCIIETWHAPGRKEHRIGKHAYQSSRTTRVTGQRFHFGKNAAKLSCDGSGQIQFHTQGPAFRIEPRSVDGGLEVQETDSIFLHKDTDPVFDHERPVDCTIHGCNEQDCSCSSYSILVGREKIREQLKTLPQVAAFFEQRYGS